MSNHYLLICEVGPIYDFVRFSRKTKDYWAASFLFSYFMAEVVKRVEKAGGKTFIPYLDNNPMITRKGKIDAGSVPDQLYFLLNDGNKDKVKGLLKTVIKEIIDDLKQKIEQAVNEKRRKAISLNADEVKEFFNFFYIIHPIDGGQPTYDEFIEAESKIKMRASVRPFNQPATAEKIKKWEKCSLCGDRKEVHSEKVAKDADLYNDEHFCSVCILKRYLWEALKDEINVIEPQYQSTSDFAAVPILKQMIAIKHNLNNNKRNDLLNNLTISYNKLMTEYKSKSEDYIGDRDGRCFFDTSLASLKGFRACFKKVEDEIKKMDKDYSPLRWLTRPFYAIVYMDGDNMGRILKDNKSKFNPYIKTVSEKISEFSIKVNEIIQKYNGQLIFAGGEDVNFIIHPEWLLECIRELNQIYNDYFANNDLTKDKKDDFTLSAGAVVCYHKYPLSIAIHGAGRMLKEHAKKYKDPAGKYPDKNATAISLIKGHTEALTLCFSNKLIGNLIDIKESLLRSEISRTTPYRIRGEKDILNALTDNTHKGNYLYIIIAGTRGAEKSDAEIQKIVGLLMKFHETEKDTMADALLYARFLAGDK